MNNRFNQLFPEPNTAPTRFFCPGRVNLIGEHIDYLGGTVLPAAISLGVTLWVRPNGTDRIRLVSSAFDDMVELQLSDLPHTKQERWSDHILGVLLQLRLRGVEIQGFDLLLDSNLPAGAGLSSSAAVEVASYFALHSMFQGKEPDRQQMALDCQQVEHQFIGVNCGIMDQFAVANAKEHHVIHLNCRTLDVEHVPFHTDKYNLVIINSNRSRKLTESAYNQRLSECAQALDIIREHHPETHHLATADEKHLKLIKNPTLQARARHAMTEQARVKAAVRAIRQRDLTTLGELLYASHASLKNDFAVSCDETDFIVNYLERSGKCLGSRMTGAGFGGCCIALVQKDTEQELLLRLKQAYQDSFGLALDHYVCQTSNGVHAILH